MVECLPSKYETKFKTPVPPPDTHQKKRSQIKSKISIHGMSLTNLAESILSLKHRHVPPVDVNPL
jgi:hypothetical protein